MDFNGLIGIAIGLILLYLLLALFCTTINEIIATTLHFRAKDLKKACAWMIDNPGLLQRFYAHGLIANDKVASSPGSPLVSIAVPPTPDVGTGDAQTDTPAPKATRAGKAGAGRTAPTAPVPGAGGPQTSASAAKPTKVSKAEQAAAAAYQAVKEAAEANVAVKRAPAAEKQAAAATAATKEVAAANATSVAVVEANVPHPSYFDPKTFAMALIGSLTEKKADGAFPTMDEIRTAVANLPVTSRIRDVLLAELATAGTSLETLRDGVATWFDKAMDRLSGTYKRHIRTLSLAVAMVLVVILNADTIHVARVLSVDEDLRNALVEKAGALLAEHTGTPAAGEEQDPPSPPGGEGVLERAPAAEPSPQPDPAGEPVPAAQAADGQAATTAASARDPCIDENVPVTERDQIEILACQAAHADDLLSQLSAFPIGWDAAKWSTLTSGGDAGDLFGMWLLKLMGLLLTGLAVSLGAPFWFDVLKRFMNVRGSGPKPPTTEEQAAAAAPKA